MPVANITLALDAMGGDHGPKVTIPAALEALKKHSKLELILVGDQAAIEMQLQKHKGASHQRLSIQHASQIVEMDDLPSQALRGKKDSSMRVAINLVKEGRAQACVSAGNTGALMATARFVLKRIEGIDRPAIMGELPNIHQPVKVLDLGANIDCCAEHLWQFAVMGSVAATTVNGMARPRVGLLNIGEEEIKGNDQIKQAAQLLSQSAAINYVGYIEANDIFMGEIDVVVCDGLLGNVALKASEGTALFIKHHLKESTRDSWLTRLTALAALPILKAFARKCDPARYNGATFLGLKGIVVKSHGGATQLGLQSALDEAVLEVEKNLPEKISDQVSALLQ